MDTILWFWHSRIVDAAVREGHMNGMVTVDTRMLMTPASADSSPAPCCASRLPSGLVRYTRPVLPLPSRRHLAPFRRTLARSTPHHHTTYLPRLLLHCRASRLPCQPPMVAIPALYTLPAAPATGAYPSQTFNPVPLFYRLFTIIPPVPSWLVLSFPLVWFTLPKRTTPATDAFGVKTTRSA